MDHIHNLQKKMDELSQMFSSKMATFESSVAAQDTSMPFVPAEYQAFKTFILKTVESLQQQMGFVLASLEELESRSRSGILLLHGVKETENEDVSGLAADTFRGSLQVPDIAAASFIACHRLGRARKSSPRPILVKFSCQRTRDAVWAAKRKFKGSGKTVSEFLTASRHSVFLEARRIFGIQYSWTSDGKVVVQCSDGSRRKVTTMEGLRSLTAPAGAGELSAEEAAACPVDGSSSEAPAAPAAAKTSAPAQAKSVETKRVRNVKKTTAASGSR